MNDTTTRRIIPNTLFDTEVHLPRSKSYTNRALIVAALADGSSVLLDPSTSDDTRILISALHKFSITVETDSKTISIGGLNGAIPAPSAAIDIGNAGTAMRFLTSFAAVANGTTHLTGDRQMQHRPIQSLLESLQMAGVKTESAQGFPPVTIHGGTLQGGSIELDATKSSQYLSSILLVAPYARKQTVIRLRGLPSSRPYIDLTIHVIRYFGGEIEVQDYKTFIIKNTSRYFGQTFQIEPDASSATYFFAAAAITGGTVRISNLSRDSLQGDIRFPDILHEMGCDVQSHANSIEVHGRSLHGIDVDMNELPDCVPALAVTAAFASGPTLLKNISHLRYKESDRLQSLAAGLTRIGAKVELESDSLTITPQRLHSATIETYNDHRIAMSFAIAGLRVPGIEITNPACVGKSFPTFWEEFRKLEPGER